MHDDSDFHVSALTGGTHGGSNGMKRTAARHGQTILSTSPLDNTGAFWSAPKSSTPQDIDRQRDTLHDKMPGE
jgi:hypothetical protein